MTIAAIRPVRARKVSQLVFVAASLLVVTTLSGEAYASSPSSFTSPGEYVFTVPAGVKTLHIAATGDNGSSLTSAMPGGAGAIVTSDLPVVPGDVLYVEVGIGGVDGGGGESDIRTRPVSSLVGLGTSQDPRLVVAGGGGAASHFFPGGAAGGSLTGPCNGGVFAAGQASYGFFDDGTGAHFAGGEGGGCQAGGLGIIWFGITAGSGGPGVGGTGSSGGGAGYSGGGGGQFSGSFPGGGGGGSSFGPMGSTFALRPSPNGPDCTSNWFCFPVGGGSVVVSFVQDASPPVTLATLDGKLGQNGWYISPVTLVLTASDPDVASAFTSGVASTNFSLDSGATWLVYNPQRPPIFSADGKYSIQYRSTDVAGNVEAAKTLTFNIDQTAPTLACSVSPDVLWPPDHKLVNIAASVNVQDATSGPAGFKLTNITSSESDALPSDMQQWVVGTTDITGLLGASRDPNGTGRTYTLVYTGADQAGNTASCSTTVLVPHDQR